MYWRRMGTTRRSLSKKHGVIAAHLPADLALDRDKPAESRRDGREKKNRKKNLYMRVGTERNKKKVWTRETMTKTMFGTTIRRMEWDYDRYHGWRSNGDGLSFRGLGLTRNRARMKVEVQHMWRRRNASDDNRVTYITRWRRFWYGRGRELDWDEGHYTFDWIERTELGIIVGNEGTFSDCLATLVVIKMSLSEQ